MICKECKKGADKGVLAYHYGCLGDTQCDCQHMSANP